MIDYSVTEIAAKGKFLDLKLREIIKYRDLIWLFVKRNYSTRYKQTILGSAWLIINPLCTVIMNTIVFGAIAGLSTDGIPKPLFYLAGNIVWALFSACLNDSAGTFTNNAGIFGKIYFPRLCNPIANAITQIGDFFIKFGLMTVIGIIFIYLGDFNFELRLEMLLLPVVLLQLAVMGIGCGIIISSFTTKY
ncbi:MAG: ABC transporter permease, partial [Succinivibrio sp.]